MHAFGLGFDLISGYRADSFGRKHGREDFAGEIISLINFYLSI